VARSHVLAVVLVLGLHATTRGQELVPGGWASQVGFQSFTGPGYPGAMGSFSQGMLGMGGYPSSGVFDGGLPTPPSVLLAPGHPQVVNGLAPFADVVRRSTRRKHVR
jgi:hypothetical protein